MLPIGDGQRVERAERASQRTTSSRRVKKKPVRMVNVRLIIFSVVAAVLLLPALWFQHYWQTSRQTRQYLQIAEDAEKKGDWKTAQFWFEQYLVFMPDDVDTQIRYANAIDKGARSLDDKSRAAALFSKIIDANPTRTDLNVRYAEVQLALSPDLARKIIEQVLERTKDNQDAHALRIRATAIDRSRNDKDMSITEITTLIGAYRKAFDRDPSHLPTALRLASLYREFAPQIAVDEKTTKKAMQDRADVMIDETVYHNRARPEAFLARFYYRRQFRPDLLRAGDGEMDDDVRKALNIDPSHHEALLAAAASILNIALNDPLAVEAGAVGPRLDPKKLNAAEQHLRTALRGNQRDNRIYLGLSQVYLLRNERDKAIAAIEDGVRIGGHFDPLMNVRLTELYLDAGRWDDAEKMFETLDDIVMGARARMRRPTDANKLDAVVKLLMASFYTADKNPKRSMVKASGLLQEASRLGAASPLSIPTNMRLGRCYMALGQWDLAVGAFRAAAGASPGAIMPKLYVADALRRGGQFDDAVRDYQQVLSIASQPGSRVDVIGVWIDLARTYLGQQALLPKDQQNWQPFEAALAQVRQLDPTNMLPSFVEVESIWIREGKAGEEKIRRIVSNTESKYASRPLFWELAVKTFLDINSFVDAERCVKEYERLTKGKAVNLRARIELARGEISDADRILSDAEKNVDSSKRLELLTRRAEMAVENGRYKEAKGILRELSAQRPDDPRPIWQMAQVAVKMRDLEDLSRLEKELLELEGPDGSFWRCIQVQRLLLEAEHGAKSNLGRAADVCRSLTNKRPTWALARAADGFIAEAQGRDTDAISSYRRAIELGDRDTSVARKLVGLFVINGQDDQAWALLQKLPPDMVISPDLLGLSVHVAIQQGQIDKAIGYSTAAIDRSPSFGEAHVLLGRAQASHTDPKIKAKAEESFRKAVEVAPSDPGVWIAQLYHYNTTDHPDAAYRSLESARGLSELLRDGSDSIPPVRQAFALARCYELLGDLRGSDRYYRKGFEENARDWTLLRLPRTTYFTNNLAESPAQLWIAQLRTAPESVRRVYGLIMGASGQASDQSMGEEFLAQDRRLLAVAAASQGGPKNRQRAIESLRRMPEGQWRRGDHILLARLYHAAGETQLCLEQYRQAGRKNPSVEQAVEAIDFALRSRSLADARLWVDMIKAQSSTDPQVARVEIALLGAEKKAGPPTLAVAQSFIGPAPPSSLSPTDRQKFVAGRIERARVACDWLAAVGQGNEATKVLRDVVGEDLDGSIVLAGWLAQQEGGISEAIEICRRAIDRDVDLRAPALTADILTYTDAIIHADKFEEAFQRALQAKGGMGMFASNLSVLREFQNRVPDALATTRKAITAFPESVAHRNNLAWFLVAYGGDAKEALSELDQVLVLGGPNQSVLDTKGVTLLALRRTEQAIRVLEACVDRPQPSAVSYLHLAEAYAQGSYDVEARRALSEAKRLGLARLNPRDTKSLRSMDGQTQFTPQRGTPVAGSRAELSAGNR